MLERLKEIDTSALTELQAIEEQRRVLRDRLDAMEARKDGVSEAVYARVRADYEARCGALDEQAGPFEEQAAGELAKLDAVREELAAARDETRLVREEVDFRHSLGEFENDEFERRLGEAAEELARRESELAEAEELRGRFLALLAPEEEVGGDAPDDAPDGGEAGDGTTSAEAEATAEAASTDGDGAAAEQPEGDRPTVADGAGEALSEGGGPEAPAEKSRITAQLSVARLELRGQDGRLGEFPLQLGTTTIGRSPRNDICIREASVSRHHAKIVFAQRGFILYDLGSENGVFVNGERVKERLLSEGDEVEFGPGLKPYVFCGPSD